MARHDAKPALPYWSKWNWGEYAKLTSRLKSGEEHAALMNLLRVYLSETGPLPNDEEQIFELADVTSEEAKQHIRSVLRRCFWLGDDGRMHNDFADSLIGIATEASEEQARRARKGLEGRQRDGRGRLVPRNKPAVAGEQSSRGWKSPAIQIQNQSQNHIQSHIKRQIRDVDTGSRNPPVASDETNSSVLPGVQNAAGDSSSSKDNTLLGDSLNSSSNAVVVPAASQLPKVNDRSAADSCSLAQVPPKACSSPAASPPANPAVPELSPTAQAAWEATRSLSLLAFMRSPRFRELPEQGQRVAINRWRRQHDPKFG
jgi:uncharacterized protein YdaU (DUF1376 family)